MTVWTLNDYTIDGIVTARKIAIPWFQTTENIHSHKAVINNTVRDVKPFRVSIKLRGSGRFTTEANIRDELKSKSVLIESSNKNIYKNKKSCWVVPTGFNVKESERTLECELAGFVDERTIHSCDFTTNWTGNSISANTSTKFGIASIKDASISAANTTKFTPTAALDLSSHAWISLWHKESKSITAELRLFTNSDYYSWALTSSTSWSHETFDLTNPTATSGTPSLGNITAAGVYSSSTSSWDVYIGWVYAE